MAGSPEHKPDKRRRGRRPKVVPNEKGEVKRSFYVDAQDYNTFLEAVGGNVSRTLIPAMTAWLSLDGNVQEYIINTLKEHPMAEAVKILREKLPEKMADMLLAQYVATLPLGRKTELIREARKKV